MNVVRPAMALVLILTAAATSRAQTAGVRPSPALEATGGWAGFLDDDVIRHGVAAAAARVYVTPRISLGPEVQYFIGPNSDRDLVVTGNVMVDVLASTPNRPRRTTPFLVAGGGWFRHTDRTGTGPFTSSEGAFTAGVGLRAWVSERLFVAFDARVGWEAHLRVAATVGVSLH